MTVDFRDWEWWDKNPQEIVVAQQDAVAVYTNPAGNIVIRQAGGPQDEDVWIVLAPAHANTVAAAILREAGLTDQPATTLPLSLSPPKDRTAAQRQRRFRAHHAPRGESNGDDLLGDAVTVTAEP